MKIWGKDEDEVLTASVQWVCELCTQTDGVEDEESSHNGCTYTKGTV